MAAPAAASRTTAQKVMYSLSPFQQKVMPGLWKDITTKLHHKVTENWISAGLLLGPVVGTYQDLGAGALSSYLESTTSNHGDLTTSNHGGFPHTPTVIELLLHMAISTSVREGVHAQQLNQRENGLKKFLLKSEDEN